MLTTIFRRFLYVCQVYKCDFVSLTVKSVLQKLLEEMNSKSLSFILNMFKFVVFRKDFLNHI